MHNCDLNKQDIHSFEVLNKTLVPRDQWGHYLDWRETDEANLTALELTSPYGHLHFAVGNSEGDEECDGDFTTFFDYAVLPDGRYILHSVENTESGGYIGDGVYNVVNACMAVEYAREMVNDALLACDVNGVRHDEEGWNQDPFYFARCVENHVAGGRDVVRREVSA